MSATADLATRLDPRPLVTTSCELPHALRGGPLTFGRYVLRASILYAEDVRTCRRMHWTTFVELRAGGVLDVFSVESRTFDGALLASERGHFRVDDNFLVFRSTLQREKSLAFEATPNRLVLRRVTNVVLDQILVRT